MHPIWNAGEPSGNWCLGHCKRRGYTNAFSHDLWVPYPLQGPGVSLCEIFLDCIRKILQSSAFFGRKMVRNAVHNAFLKTLTAGTALPRVLPSK